jgi:outer membrane protein OmpA-like peptidoglycan-associated protein
MKKSLGRIVVTIIMVIIAGAFINVGFLTAEELARDGRFIAYNDGTVLDTQTNLLWAAQDNGSDIDWPDAKAYCENYNGGGYKDWRMPTQQELNGLYDRLIVGNNGYRLTKLITLTGAFPWASEVRGSEAAYVSFFYDRDLWCWDPLSRKNRHRTLPVRYGRVAKVVKIEELPPLPRPLPLPLPTPEKVTITLYLEFDHDKASVGEIYHKDIKKVADFMKLYPGTTVVIEGHTDEIGTKEYNQRLSEERARSVLQYLVDHFGISDSRVTSIGCGEDRPIADNYTVEGRRKNRRVEAVISTMVTK